MKTFLKSIYILPLAIIATLILSACSADTAKIEACNSDHDTALTQGTCVMQIALEKESENAALKVCNQIDNGVANTCKRNVAVKFEDKDLCFDNENEIETYICLTNLAEKKKDVSICGEIERQKDEYFCYRKVAVATLDPSLCDNVTGNDEFKQTCVESVEFTKTYVPEEEIPTVELPEGAIELETVPAS